VVRAHPTVPNKSYSYRKLRGTVDCCSYQIATTTVLVRCAVRARPNFDRMARRANAPSVRPLSVGCGRRVSKEKRCTRADIVSSIELNLHVERQDTRTETNEASGEESERDIPFMKGYTVFNVEQVEGQPASSR
jgi:hypothetical protein